MRALILPNSNADVERIFSAMNHIKSKIRNSMKTNLLNAILVTRFGLIRNGKGCISCKLPDSVVIAIGISQAYMSSTETSYSTVQQLQVQLQQLRWGMKRMLIAILFLVGCNFL